MPESLTRHAVAAPGREEVISLALEQNLHPWTVEKVPQPPLRFLAQWYQALVVAFAHDSQDALIEIDLGLFEVD